MKRKWQMAAWILCLAWMMPLRALAAAQPESLQEAQAMVEAAAAGTAGYNLRVVNYSDPSAEGVVRECDGSGVIFAIDETTVYISTAEHCLKYEHTKVQFADGSEQEALVAYQNPAKDVGFLLVGLDQLSPETAAAVAAAPGADAEAIGERPGNILFAVSSADAPNGVISGGFLDSCSVPYPNNLQQNVLQFYSGATYGSSGGGVYTLDGIWIGSVSGGNTLGKCWAVPYADIEGEFAGWMALLAYQAQAISNG